MALLVMLVACGAMLSTMPSVAAGAAAEAQAGEDGGEDKHALAAARLPPSDACQSSVLNVRWQRSTLLSRP